MSDEQTQKVSQGVEFKFATVEDEIKLLEARIKVLKSRLKNEEMLTRAAQTFSEIVQAPLEEVQAQEVDDALSVRDDRVPVAEPEPVELETAAEPSIFDGVELESEPGFAPEPKPEPGLGPLLAQPVPSTIVQGGKEIPVHREDGGVLEQRDPGVTGVPTLNAPPAVGTNPNFKSG